MTITLRFDPVIHAPNRLQLCAILQPLAVADFAVIRDVLDVSDSALSKHLKVLTDAGYVEIEKVTMASRVRTRVSLTDAGRRAYLGHVGELRRLLADGLEAPTVAEQSPAGARTNQPPDLDSQEKASGEIMSDTPNPCPECGASGGFRYRKSVDSGGAYGPNLLPHGSPRRLSTAKMRIVVCSGCGHIRMFADPDVVEQLAKSDKWEQI